MYQEIQLCCVKDSEAYTHSKVTLIGPQSEEHLKCMDDCICLGDGQIVYIVKVSNGQSIVIYYYEMEDFFAKGCKLTTEYLQISHLITQNGCTLIKDTNQTPYLFVLTQGGEIYYKNLHTHVSHIIKNLLADNQKFVCLAKKLQTQNKLSLYLLSESNILHQIQIDVVKGEFQRLKYQLSFGWFQIFGTSSNDWKTAFELNENLILHYSFQTQFSLLELRDQDFTTRQLSLPENIKVKQIEVYLVNNLYNVAYVKGDELKVYSIQGHQLRLIHAVRLQSSNFVKLSAISNTLFIIQQNVVYQVSQELQSITDGKYPLLGYLNQLEYILIFYKHQITLINKVQNTVSIQQAHLNKEVEKFKDQADILYKLKDEELIIQTTNIDFDLYDKITQFQVLIKFLHRNLDPQIVLRFIKDMGDNFYFDELVKLILLQVEDIYIYLKPTIQKLELDLEETSETIFGLIKEAEEQLEQIFSQPLVQLKNLSEQRMKTSLLRNSIIRQLKDYYHLLLESYLGIAVLCDLVNKGFEYNCQYHLFYQVTRLLCMLKNKSLSQYQEFVRQNLNNTPMDLQNIRSLSQTTKQLIGALANYTIPDEYMSEAFVRDQQKSIIDKNDAFQLIRFYRIAQQTDEVNSNAVRFISQNQEQYQELKMRMAFLLHKNSDNSNEQRQIHQSLIHYAIKQNQQEIIFHILNESSIITEQVRQIIENGKLFNFQLSARILEQVGDLLVKQAKKSYQNIQKAGSIIEYFSFLMKMDFRQKAYATIFEFIMNLEMLLFRLNMKQVGQCVTLQLDCISLLTNQMLLVSRTDDQLYANQIVCRLNDQCMRQFLNPSFINDKSQINDDQPLNIQIIHLDQIYRFRQYKQIQNNVCQTYYPEASFQRVIEALIQNNDITNLIKILPLDPEKERTIAFFYYCNQSFEILTKVRQLFNQSEESRMLALLSVANNLTVDKTKELFRMAPTPEYFLQYLLNVDKEQMAQMIV